MITKQQIKKLEQYTDALFQSVGIDTNYSKHFIQRLTHKRNKRPITMEELRDMFRKVHRRYARKIAKLGHQSQAVLKDMESDINIPFVIKWDSRNMEFDLVTKTIMRKKDFKTSNRVFAVEELKEAMNEELSDAQKKKREEIVKELKNKKDELKDRYGDDWESAMYGIATKKAKQAVSEGKRYKDFVAEAKKAKKKKNGKKDDTPADKNGASEKVKLSGKRSKVEINPDLNEV